MSAHIDNLIREIHAAVVGDKKPPESELVKAARRVVHARYKTDSWEALKDAIAELAGIVGGDE